MDNLTTAENSINTEYLNQKIDEEVLGKKSCFINYNNIYYLLCYLTSNYIRKLIAWYFKEFNSNLCKL